MSRGEDGRNSHGCSLNKMDNNGFESEKGCNSSPQRNHHVNVELGEVTSTETVKNGTCVSSAETPATTSCHQMLPEKRLIQEGPWNRLKSIFLIGILVLLALWVLVFTLLHQYEVI